MASVYVRFRERSSQAPPSHGERPGKATFHNLRMPERSVRHACSWVRGVHALARILPDPSLCRKRSPQTTPKPRPSASAHARLFTARKAPSAAGSFRSSRRLRLFSVLSVFFVSVSVPRPTRLGPGVSAQVRVPSPAPCNAGSPASRRDTRSLAR